MLHRVFCALVFAPAVLAQTSPDTQALQALVAEIRQLRQDLQVTTVASQRVQIVLYRLQAQTALVTRATARLDEARANLGHTQSERTDLAARVPRIEDTLRNSQNPTEHKSLEDAVSQLKARMESLAGDEQRLQAREAEADSQLRAEQARLSDLQDQLDKLDKILDSLSRK